MLNKAQQAYLDEAFARVGKPSAALQFQIDQIRSAKTEAELTQIFTRDADVVRPKVEAELLCAVMLTKLAEINSSINTKNLEDERRVIKNYKTETEMPVAPVRQYGEPQSKQKEFFNIAKAIGLIVLIFFGGVALLSAIFDRKHTGPAVEYTILSTTVNGQSYEKEETTADLGSDYVTFSDGVRVPWSAVKITRSKFYPDELGMNTNSAR